MIEKIQQLNPDLKLYSIHNPLFRMYGEAVQGYDFSELIAYINEKTAMPESGNAYTADLPDTHSMKIFGEMEQARYGAMPIQLGYCNGYNSMLDALEYHKGNEIDVAVTDCILLLEMLQDIKDGMLSTNDVEAFYVKAGEAVELYGTTLHFAPCKVNEAGYKTAVILPKGTNLALSEKDKREPMLRMSNKWLIAHPDCKRFAESDAYLGMVGSNICVRFEGSR